MKKLGYHGEGGRDIYEYGWTFGYPENENQTFVNFDSAEAFHRISQLLQRDDIEFKENAARVITDVYLDRIELNDAIPLLQDEENSDTSDTDNYTYSRYPDGRPNYEVSSAGDPRFSARDARFAPGTILFGHDVSGRTIESVYQHGVKQGDWITDNNEKTDTPKDKTIIKGNTEDDSYTQGYLPLWQEWARQNP